MQDITLAYIACIMLGMAMLFAYNSFVSSPDYIKDFYRYAGGNQTAVAEYPRLWSNMMAIVVVLSMVPNVIGQLFLLTPYARALRLRTRVITSLAALLLSIAVVALLPALRPNEAGAAAGLMTAVGVAGFASAFFQSSTFSLASMLPDNCVQGVMLGQGVSGSVASLLQILSKLAMGEASFDDTRRQAYLYFGIGLGWMALCLGVALALTRLRLVRRCVPELRFPSDHFEDGDEDVAGGSPTAVPATVGNGKGDQETTSLVSGGIAGAGGSNPDAVAVQVLDGDTRKTMVQVCRSIAHLMLAVFLCFAVTLFLFPAIVVRASDGDWFGILIVLCYNVGDTIGRFVCRFRAVQINEKRLLPIAACRFVLVPVVMLCVAPKVITTQAVPFVAIIVCGLTNGFTASLCMMYGPTLPSIRDDERGAAGSAMSFSLLAGCSLGCLVALLVNALTQS